jgi:hypothetical protein
MANKTKRQTESLAAEKTLGSPTKGKQPVEQGTDAGRTETNESGAGDEVAQAAASEAPAPTEQGAEQKGKGALPPTAAEGGKVDQIEASEPAGAAEDSDSRDQAVRLAPEAQPAQGQAPAAQQDLPSGRPSSGE